MPLPQGERWKRRLARTPACPPSAFAPRWWARRKCAFAHPTNSLRESSPRTRGPIRRGCSLGAVADGFCSNHGRWLWVPEPAIGPATAGPVGSQGRRRGASQLTTVILRHRVSPSASPMTGSSGVSGTPRPSRFNHQRLWNAGSPAFAGDDSLMQMSNSAKVFQDRHHRA
jgi:hypothetical protein